MNNIGKEKKVRLSNTCDCVRACVLLFCVCVWGGGGWGGERENWKREKRKKGTESERETQEGEKDNDRNAAKVIKRRQRFTSAKRACTI